MASIVTLGEGQVLFRQGEPAPGYCIVTDGLLKLYRVTLSGEEIVIRVLGAGESLAEASTFTGDTHLATAEAVTVARVIRIPREHVIRCIHAAPDIAVAIIASTSRSLRRFILQVDQLKAQSGVQRVAEFLASLCTVHSGPCVIALPYGKTLIARTLGLKPESLSRVFARLASAGVQVRRSRVAVRDVGMLHQLAGDAHKRSPSAGKSGNAQNGRRADSSPQWPVVPHAARSRPHGTGPATRA